MVLYILHSNKKQEIYVAVEGTGNAVEQNCFYFIQFVNMDVKVMGKLHNVNAPRFLAPLTLGEHVQRKDNCT